MTKVKKYRNFPLVNDFQLIFNLEAKPLEYVLAIQNKTGELLQKKK